MKLIAALLLTTSPLLAAEKPAPIEVGIVNWQRDLDAAKHDAKKTGKPVLAFFQEVPGCAGCQKFGREVMSHPLIVEAIESNFNPVLIYNNRGGKDAELLKAFKEPAWNYQVMRFLDSDGQDIIPRKDQVWTTGALAARLVETLETAKRPVPAYLSNLVLETDTARHKVVAFAMFCYYTGELKLGAIDGVIATEAGWLEGREVTLVKYHQDQLALETLVKKAAEVKCAQKVYVPDAEDLTVAKKQRLDTGILNLKEYKTARASEQKVQLRGTPFDALGVTAMQRTKLNAFARTNKAKASEWLSPRQRSGM
ncbi:MAG: hypothetical protein ACI9TH_004173 [Kiritimatiellia bacterium]|jgi:hypothetical protein